MHDEVHDMIRADEHVRAFHDLFFKLCEAQHRYVFVKADVEKYGLKLINGNLVRYYIDGNENTIYTLLSSLYHSDYAFMISHTSYDASNYYTVQCKSRDSADERYNILRDVYIRIYYFSAVPLIDLAYKSAKACLDHHNRVLIGNTLMVFRKSPETEAVSAPHECVGFTEPTKLNNTMDSCKVVTKGKSQMMGEWFDQLKATSSRHVLDATASERWVEVLYFRSNLWEEAR